MVHVILNTLTSTYFYVIATSGCHTTAHPPPHFDPTDFPVRLTYVLTSLKSKFFKKLNLSQVVETSREKVSKRVLREIQHAPPAAAPPRQHTDFYKRIKLDEHSQAIIRSELTRENYKEKFHHLLCWEEKEHEKILADR